MTVLYEFHYEYMKAKFGDHCKLLYTDTDSLIYDIKCEDIYELIKADVHERFDTSDYPEQNQYGMPRVNKKRLGVMKDECNGKIITEFLGIRSKVYCVLVEFLDRMKKAKGVKTNVLQNTIDSDDFRECLFQNIQIYREQCRIAAEYHDIYTIQQKKLALSPFDDKRCLFEGQTDTLPWGHILAQEIEMLLQDGVDM